MANIKNHRPFTLRCLSNSIIPVSVQLKSNIKTPNGIYIIKKGEKALLNERVRMINNTINMFSWQIDTCIEELQNKIKKEDMEECHRFIERQRETKHLKTLRDNKRSSRDCAIKIQVAAQTMYIVALVATQTLTQPCHHYTINNKTTSHQIECKIRPNTKTTTTTKTGSGTYPEDCSPRHKRRS